MKNLIIGIFLFAFSFQSFSQGVNDIYEVYAIPFANVNRYIPVKEISINPVVQDSVRIVFMTWLLNGKNGRKVLVDAGFQRNGKYFTDWVSDFIRPDSTLVGLNLKPADITDIIITHPHWDHIGGI